MSDWTVEEAEKIGNMLVDTSNKLPVRPLRYQLYRQGKEWLRAARELDGCDEGEAAIELIGNVVRGMSLVGDSETGWVEVVAINNGGTGVGVDQDGRTIWRNFHGSTSPVVVRA